jgi:hypothetical protein
MAEKINTNQGLERMVQGCRQVFQQNENINHYDAADYQAAERKFVKYCLLMTTGQTA